MMKLIHAAKNLVEPKFLEIEGYQPGWFGKLLKFPKRRHIVVPNPVYELSQRERYVTATIDFELSPAAIGQVHYQPVAFGSHLYEGVMPVSHVCDNIWECSVNKVTHIQLAPKYKPIPEMR
jgi:hypothetical protein